MNAQELATHQIKKEIKSIGTTIVQLFRLLNKKEVRRLKKEIIKSIPGEEINFCPICGIARVYLDKYWECTFGHKFGIIILEEVE